MYYKRHYRVNQKNNKRRDKHRRDNAKNCHAKSVNSKKYVYNRNQSHTKKYYKKISKHKSIPFPPF